KKDRLYMPTDQLYKISRYIGPDSGRPKITRLGSTEWAKATKRVRESVKKLALDLLSLYHERMQGCGYKFSPDMVWQQELESAFIHQESNDQISAINDVKRDMESNLTMDRLVCGDVGYGKTEVALRAAFKAIMDSKQVMLLVPTTILAEQHFLTFKERFAPYPIIVEMLSRFRTRAQQREIVDKIQSGQIDLVIGTHRLLQKDLQFKDLGLLIIDEEQRFGVKHKETLRNIKKEVDVLTLTATPIPRTLQMSLSGIRDLSIIDTPPEGRRPVVTYVGEYRTALINMAIRRELNRGGQIFYLHNRVTDIHLVAKKITKAFPAAMVGIGHGQMVQGALEKTMQGFINKKIDIIVCTTIIESGIDIANANTLIIEGAENLGLSQMYQLRGRIGRSGHQAFAYFTYPAGSILTGASLDRLRTIAKFTELGSGFKIALRDLEIRGAGSLLGSEQHGHLAAVGFEYYCRLLRDAIDEVQGKPLIKISETQIDIPLIALIPDYYMPDSSLRLEIYRKIAGTGNQSDLASLKSEILDRFGEMPEPVVNLFRLAELKHASALCGIKLISLHDNILIIKGMEKKEFKTLMKALGQKFDCKLKSERMTLSCQVPLSPLKVILFLSGFINDIIST
ncbi:MAG TPA: transcription-repair coupling factor, partial [Actinobacteria bacterium]|nr:transcription-repair coupling factor [Actinomycetes bacterium]HEX21208.1 transcription-repair coupling factor [Actinomycetota bacterium]